MRSIWGRLSHDIEFIVLAGGLFASYVLHGYVTERLFRREGFTFGGFVALVQTLSVCCLGIAVFVSRKKWQLSASVVEYAVVGIATVLALATGTEALSVSLLTSWMQNGRLIEIFSVYLLCNSNSLQVLQAGAHHDWFYFLTQVRGDRNWNRVAKSKKSEGVALPAAPTSLFLPSLVSYFSTSIGGSSAQQSIWSALLSLED